MKINIKRIDDALNMEATNEQGNSILMDGAPDIGGNDKGMRPMQLLLSALGGCSAIDVILILKKQKQEIESFEIEVDGNREKTGDVSLFKNIVLHFKIKGKVDQDKAERAVQLSVDKYCSVSKTLEPTAKITYKVSVN
ncbi:MAG: OsmC family protein [Bacteroidetes bacterium]|nr:OsmC family protein [Bacteroidota bacterium]